jgi:hypothetical protein
MKLVLAQGYSVVLCDTPPQYVLTTATTEKLYRLWSGEMFWFSVSMNKLFLVPDLSALSKHHEARATSPHTVSTNYFSPTTNPFLQNHSPYSPPDDEENPMSSDQYPRFSQLVF